MEDMGEGGFDTERITCDTVAKTASILSGLTHQPEPLNHIYRPDTHLRASACSTNQGIQMRTENS